jgi:hypothetical protein
LSATGWLLDNRSHNVLSAAGRIPWVQAADVAAKSFLWFGGWSFLTMKSWIYRIPEIIAVCAIPALVLRRPPGTAAPATITVFAFAAYCWGILVYFATQGVPNLPGWYLWPFAPALAILLTAGLGRASLAMVIVFAALDIYGAATLMAPWYAGLAAHNHGSITQFPEAAARLQLNWWLITAWVGSTIAIPAIALKPTAIVS